MKDILRASVAVIWAEIPKSAAQQRKENIEKRQNNHKLNMRSYISVTSFPSVVVVKNETHQIIYFRVAAKHFKN